MSRGSFHNDERPWRLSRRSFLKATLGVGFGVLAAACTPADPLGHVRGRMVNPDVAAGHRLRRPRTLPPPAGNELETGVLIVGGGISGLSALRRLRAGGIDDVLLIELEPEAGGNSIGGRNAQTRYPWAAHYLPIPDPRNTQLLQFLESCGVITGYRDGLPVYNEYHLCSDPEERLYINGYWQEGLVPAHGLSRIEREEIKRFFDLIGAFRDMRGSDGREAFCIPVASASRDSNSLSLDRMSFGDWLDREGYRSKALRWYLDYCCMDDYGMKAESVSAWAGIHYFAGRKGKGANATHSDLLTWPEGNAFLMEALRRGSEAHIRTRKLVSRISGPDAEGRRVAEVFDTALGRSQRIRCREIVLAVPHFIGSRLLDAVFPEPQIAHVPWMVANLRLKQLPQGSGQGLGLCWDNVIYGADNVGYVNARHQQASVQTGPQHITYYKPLTAGSPQSARQEAFSRGWRGWLEAIVADLSPAHPGFAENLLDADVRVWGHGMAGPLPGFLDELQSRRVDIPGVELAHTDYSGISIFEEAFYQGLNAAETILKRRS